jgi:hypothetical protein
MASSTRVNVVFLPASGWCPGSTVREQGNALLGISKRGDKALRRRLVQCALVYGLVRMAA